MTEQHGRVEATLLPAGWLRETEQATAAPARPRRPRWDVLLAALLAIGALVVTVLAVRGLGDQPPPAAPAAAGPPGSAVTVIVSGGTDLRVSESLVLPRPAGTVRLTRPTSTASIRLPLPQLRELTARDAAGPLRVRDAGTGWTVEAADGRQLSTITVGYLAAGAVTSEAEAAAGRALLLVTPVTADAAREAAAPVQVQAPGTVVRQAVCITSPTTQQLCGATDDPGTAELRAWQGDAVVILQVDLR